MAKYTTAEERERARTWRGWDSLAPFFREYIARLDTHLEAALAALRQSAEKVHRDRGHKKVWMYCPSAWCKEARALLEPQE